VGKTAFVERLIAALKARGTRVATVKHSREDFDIDHPNTDTWRYRRAGSDVVVISAPGRVAMVEEREEEATLEEIIGRLPAGIDLVITEGFKRLPLPKIEVTTRQAWESEGRITPEGLLLAVVSDDDIPGAEGAPRFRRDDIEGVVGLLDGLGMVKSCA
jgi:molybdopterin-guanine dinucleotide biosynthesis protein B